MNDLRARCLRSVAPALVGLALAGCGDSSSDASSTSATTGSGTSGAGGDKNTSSGSSNGSGGSGTSSNASSGTGGSGGSVPTGREPTPPDSSAGAPDGTGVTVFAISKLYLGDTDRDGTQDKANGWKNYGYDVDHKISTSQSTDLCQIVGNASAKSVYPDGTDGIDNGFGKGILPIFFGISSDASSEINDAIASGTATHLFALQKLGSGASYNGLFASEYLGAPLGSAPKFDGTDKWPVMTESLADPKDITQSKYTFTDGYLVGNTWVGKLDVFALHFGGGFTGQQVALIHSAVITMDLSPSHTSATNGTISGILDPKEYDPLLTVAIDQQDASLCNSTTLASIIEQVNEASDILADGTQDPNKVCDGISIGLGFDAKLVQLGSIAPAQPPPADPCKGQ